MTHVPREVKDVEAQDNFMSSPILSLYLCFSLK